ncbi:MAG: ABC transporter substrate-binding protein, partial [Nostoc sp.]|uniref:ABC transporter substrate-binding protein n=1 Tax=Nostoc sp. TaxID=1180 RepID=UPI002FFCB1A5
MGETIIPAHPQRVAILVDALLEPAFALGVKPIAAPKNAVSHLQELVGKLRGIELLDWPSPNIEKLLRLKPDLILGFSSHQDIYPLLSHIAPTVLATFDPVAPWKGFLVFTADALGKTDLAQQLMANYYRRLAQLRTSMSQRRLTTVVSVVELRSDGF